MEKVMVSLTKEMKDALEEERKKRYLDSIPETIRTILSDHLVNLAKAKDINQINAEAYVSWKKKQDTKALAVKKKG